MTAHTEVAAYVGTLVSRKGASPMPKQKCLAVFLAIATIMPQLTLQVSAFPALGFRSIGAISVPQDVEVFTKVTTYSFNNLLYLRHGYNFGDKGNYSCRPYDNNFNRTHRYCGDQYSHYKHYSWPYIGLGFGFLYELGAHDGSEREGRRRKP
jgi:hypothetical protein